MDSSPLDKSMTSDESQFSRDVSTVPDLNNKGYWILTAGLYRMDLKAGEHVIIIHIKW